MTNSRILTITLVVVGVSALVIFKPTSKNNDKSKKTTDPKNIPASNVTGYIVRAENIKNNIQVTGTILANQEVELHSEVSGKIVKLIFKEGTNVNKGELLIKINDADLQAQIKKATYLEKLAQEKEFRQKKLLDISAISKEEYDVVLNDLNTVKADADLVRAQIAKTEIRAPFSGKIGLRSVNEGSYITPTTMIASIQDISPVKIDFAIPERYLENVKIGNPIVFTIPGSGKKFNGKIYAIEPKIDIASRSIKLRAVCDNNNGAILPGSFAQIELELNAINNAIMVPTEAIIPELKGQKVFVSRQGKAQPQKIETGLRNDQKIQVTSGLEVGDTLITTGIMQLKKDTPVKVKIK